MISPLGRGLDVVHIAGNRFGTWQGCVSCRTTLATPMLGWWWRPGQRVAENTARIYATGDELAAGEVLCAGAN